MKKKRIIFYILFALLVFLGIFSVSVAVDYIEYQGVVKAAVGGECPMIEGSRSIKVTPCQRDTPIILPVRCMTSCPVLDPTLTFFCSQQIAEAVGCIAGCVGPCNPVVVCAKKVADAIKCQACENYYEVMLNPAESQFGNIVLGVPKTFFNYKGGGTNIMTNTGQQLIWCGNSNVDPIIIGIPSLAVRNVEKAKDWFDKYIIAGFKDLIK